MVVTVNVPNVPVANVVLLALVITGAWAAATVRVKLWAASGDTPLEAVIVSVYVPKVPAVGVPASVAVPLSFATKVTPDGSTPVSLSEGVGTPVVETVKLLEMPVVNVVAAALVIAGARAAATVSVKLWVAAGDTPLEAVIVSAYVPKVLAAGVPASVAVPLSFATKVTPDGSTPVSLTEGVGTPVVVTSKLLEMSVVNVVAAALVIAGARLAATVSVKLWVAAGDTPLEAMIVNGYVPALPAAGVPERLAVPLSLSTKVTPEGSVPDSLSEGVGSPVVVTVKPLATLTVNVVAAALVIAGAWGAATVSVKLWVASGVMPLTAVIVTGYVPAVPAAGVPPSVAVPLLFATKVTPEGNVPVSLSVGVGIPDVVIVKLPE